MENFQPWPGGHVIYISQPNVAKLQSKCEYIITHPNKCRWTGRAPITDTIPLNVPNIFSFIMIRN